MADLLGLQASKILDPRLNNDGFQGYAMNMGGATVNYKRQNANSSSGNNSNLSFSPIIATTSVLDRRIMTEVNMVLTFTGSVTPPATGNLLKEGHDAPRMFSSIVSNLSLRLNQENLTEEPKDTCHWMARFVENDKQTKSLSIVPFFAAPDRTQSYEEAQGTHWNALGGFSYSSPTDINRGLYDIDIVSNTATSAVVNLKIFDYLFLSPMVYNNELYEGIPNISDFNLTYNFDSRLARIWSHSNAGGSTISNLQVSIGQAFLNFTEITPPASVNIPKSIILPYHEKDKFITNTNSSIAPNTVGDLFSTNFSLTTVPTKCIIFAKEAESQFNDLESQINKPDVYGSIESISITYANQNSLFANCNQEQLYMISEQNGVNMSFQEWKGQTTQYNNTEPGGKKRYGLTGSIFCFDFGRDCSVNNPSLLTGVSSNTDFKIDRIKIKNTSNRPIVYDLYVYMVNDAVLEIELGRCRKFRSMVLPSEAITAPIQAHDERELLKGGNFKSFLKNFMTGLVKHPVTKAVASNTADQLLGQPERDLLRKYTGIGVTGSGVVGTGVVTGNALVGKRQLRQRM